MRGTFIDITGLVFGRWTVLERATNGKEKKPRWLCQCSCGTIRTVTGYGLRDGSSKSCGCLAKEVSSSRHGINHSNWKGGIWHNNAGYIAMLNPTHPNANKTGYVLEHIFVMSEFLGRPLTK